MREINVVQIKDTVKKLFYKANYSLGEDVVGCIKNSIEKEISPIGKSVLEKLVEKMKCQNK
jgi:fumarate hydratase subunit alpha